MTIYTKEEMPKGRRVICVFPHRSLTCSRCDHRISCPANEFEAKLKRHMRLVHKDTDYSQLYDCNLSQESSRLSIRAGSAAYQLALRQTNYNKVASAGSEIL